MVDTTKSSTAKGCGGCLIALAVMLLISFLSVNSKDRQDSLSITVVAVATVVLIGSVIWILNASDSAKKVHEVKLREFGDGDRLLVDQQEDKMAQPILYLCGSPEPGVKSCSCYYSVYTKSIAFYNIDHSLVAHLDLQQMLDIHIMDKSSFVKSNDAGALVTLGLLGLGFQKTEKLANYYLSIHYISSEGIEQFLMFSSVSVDTLSRVKTVIEENVNKETYGSTICPYCGEPIRKIAKLCKHCRSEL